jgi:hypothetical protein
MHSACRAANSRLIKSKACVPNVKKGNHLLLQTLAACVSQQLPLIHKEDDDRLRPLHRHPTTTHHSEKPLVALTDLK